jgi:hypothetical protein
VRGLMPRVMVKVRSKSACCQEHERFITLAYFFVNLLKPLILSAGVRSLFMNESHYTAKFDKFHQVFTFYCREPGKTKILHSMFKFLLIFPTPALEKNVDPRNTSCIPAVNIFFRLGFEQIS